MKSTACRTWTSYLQLPVTLLCLLCMSVLTASAQSHGWDVYGEEGRIEQVVLVELRGDSLVIARGESTRAIPVEVITELYRPSRNNHSETGAIVGMIGGFLIGAASTTEPRKPNTWLNVVPDYTADWRFTGMVGALLGGGVGVVVGLAITDSKSFDLTELSIPARLLLIEEILAGAR